MLIGQVVANKYEIATTIYSRVIDYILTRCRIYAANIMDDSAIHFRVKAGEFDYTCYFIGKGCSTQQACE